MSWIKAAGIRAIKTTLQTLIASVTVTTITSEDVKLAVIASLGAGVLSLLNSAISKLPEVDDDEPDMSVTPDIEDEEIIDTSKKDAKLNGGGVDE